MSTPNDTTGGGSKPDIGGLRACFDLVAPDFPPALVPPAVVPGLRSAITNLVSVSPYRVGLECRLSAESAQVDLQQGLGASGAARKELRNHVAKIVARAEEAVHPAWRRLETFCAAWCDPASPVHGGVVDFWLEFDLHSDDPAAAAPSVFLGLPQNPAEASKTFDLAVAVLEMLGGAALSGARLEVLRRCFEACAEGEFVSHLGVMLARDTPWLRVNIKQVPACDIPDFLRRVGWPGDQTQLGEVLPRLAAFTDGITTCLDVAEDISPRLGLECFIENKVGRESRWRAFLQRLVSDGLCAPEKAEALLAWPGYIDPTQTSGPWPTALMRQALQQPPEHFSAIERALSHVKVTCAPSHAPEAKAYFGFNHVWLKPVVSTPVAKKAMPAPGPAFSPPDVSASLAHGIGFLLNARSFTGWWNDYGQWEEGGASTEWVTAYVGSALAEFSATECRRAAIWALALLEHSRSETEGWGWAQHAPADADSTGWGLRLAQLVGESGSERVARAGKFFAMHCFPDGVHTYHEEYYLRFTGYAVAPPDLRTYFEQHACVTAAAAMLPEHQVTLLGCLRNLQQPDGRWISHWWPDDDYATAFAVEALKAGAETADHPRIERAIRWTRSRLSAEGCVRTKYHPDGSAFATSLALRTLLLTADLSAVRDVVTASARWLVEHQDTDGSWVPSAEMFVRRAHEPIIECRGLITTATVLTSLRLLRQKLHTGAVRCI